MMPTWVRNTIDMNDETVAQWPANLREIDGKIDGANEYAKLRIVQSVVAADYPPICEPPCSPAARFERARHIAGRADQPRQEVEA